MPSSTNEPASQPEYSDFYDFWLPLSLLIQYFGYGTVYDTITRGSSDEVAALVTFCVWSVLVVTMCLVGRGYANETAQNGLKKFYTILTIINTLAVCFCGFGAAAMHNPPVTN